MPQDPNRLSQFWQELKRRKVIRVITVYAAAAFMILELVSMSEEPFGLPGWTFVLAVILLSIGFLISVIWSWIYDIHPEGGIVRTEPAYRVKADEIQKSSTGWKIASYFSFVVIAGLIILNIVPGRKSEKAFSELEKSIAVLPFENLSADEEFAHIGVAFTDEIIMELQKIKAFDRVLSRTSTMQYGVDRPTIPEIAEKLDVNYLIEGTILRYENDVHVNVQVIRATPEDHIWAEEYEGKWEDIISIQDEIAYSVANELKMVLSPEEKLEIDRAPTENIQAYNLYLQGRYLFSRGNLDSCFQYFRKALEIDPGYALAYSGMAATYSSYASSGRKPRREMMPLAKEAAEKALSLDNTLAEAHNELAWTRIYQDFDWEEGERGLKRAIQLNPNYAKAHMDYSLLLTMTGRHNESIQEAEFALERDPQYYKSWIPRAYFYARNYGRAIEEFNKYLEKNPEDDYARNWLAAAYLFTGRIRESRLECDRIKNPDWVVGFVYGKLGETEKVQEMLDRYIELEKTEYVHPTHYTALYLSLGDKERAIEYLEEAYNSREGWLVLLKVEPLYDDLRTDPRFQRIMNLMNYPQ